MNEEILSYLDVRDVVKLRTLSKDYNDIIKPNSFFSRVMKRYGLNYTDNNYEDFIKYYTKLKNDNRLDISIENEQDLYVVLSKIKEVSEKLTFGILTIEAVIAITSAINYIIPEILSLIKGDVTKESIDEAIKKDYELDGFFKDVKLNKEYI